MGGDIYLRILSRLDAPSLARHCSVVFDDELKDIHVELREIFAAYERLQEVRDAVDKLENGRTDVSRSASLMETVESTARLQGELRKRLDVIQFALPSHRVAAIGSVKTEQKPVKEEELVAAPQKRKRDVVASDERVEMAEKKKTNSKKTKRDKYESAALEATESHKSLLASPWPSSDPTSDTESEADEAFPKAAESAETEMENPLAEPPTAKATDAALATQLMVVAKITEDIQHLASTKRHPPSLDKVTSFVQSFRQVLDSVSAEQSKSDVKRLLSEGLNSVASQSVVLFDRCEERAFWPLLKETIQAIQRAGHRNGALAKLHSRHTGDLQRIYAKHKAQAAMESQRAEEEAARGEWNASVRALLASAQRLAEPSRVVKLSKLQPFMESVCQMVTAVVAQPRTERQQRTTADFFRVVACTVGILGKPELDASFVPLVNSMMATLDRALAVSSVFRDLALPTKELTAIRDRLRTGKSELVEGRSDTDKKKKKADKMDSESAHFVALLAIAKELQAMPPSQRRGRVSNFAFTLQKEIKTLLPKQGPMAAPSTATYDAVADVVIKAIELIQQESHGDDTDTVYKQFLELLFGTGARYKPFKELVARSRDDLYGYLYPESKPQQKANGQSQAKTQEFQDDASHIDEATLRERLAVAFADAQSWEGDVFSLKQYDHVASLVAVVMKHESDSWRVRRDRTVRECIELLSSRAQAIKKKEHRETRMATLAKWDKLLEYKRRDRHSRYR